MIRKANSGDIPRIIELGKTITTEYEKQNNLEVIINKDYNKIYVFIDKEKCIGFIHLTELYESAEIINIAVDQKYQQQGIASKLIEYSIDNLKTVENITLEVRESNIPAIKLYKKNGFEIINIRKDYYQNENGYLMERRVI